jgi:hypothetical protein
MLMSNAVATSTLEHPNAAMTPIERRPMKNEGAENEGDEAKCETATPLVRATINDTGSIAKST